MLCMARDQSIAISVEERETLRKAREDIFGTDEVSYGLTIERLVEEHFND